MSTQSSVSAAPGSGTPLDFCAQSPSGALLRALGEFNRGDWFECHETLEELWAGTTGEIRDFYQGMLQMAVALHHWRNGNFNGSVHLLATGADMLRRVRPACQRIDVAALISEADGMRATLLALQPERMHELDPSLLPRLRLVPLTDTPP